ncbi:hypothetical protein P885DRAFT_73584 [Corynascus similis CBS 632.67]
MALPSQDGGRDVKEDFSISIRVLVPSVSPGWPGKHPVMDCFAMHSKFAQITGPITTEAQDGTCSFRVSFGLVNPQGEDEIAFETSLDWLHDLDQSSQAITGPHHFGDDGDGKGRAVASRRLREGTFGAPAAVEQGGRKAMVLDTPRAVCHGIGQFPRTTAGYGGKVVASPRLAPWLIDDGLAHDTQATESQSTLMFHDVETIDSVGVKIQAQPSTPHEFLTLGTPRLASFGRFLSSVNVHGVGTENVWVAKFAGERLWEMGATGRSPV